MARNRQLAGLALAVATVLGAAAACVSHGPALPPPPAHPHGGVLWHILHDQCVPGQQQHASPAPCAEVSLAGGEAAGFVVLKDRDGIAQYLLMPTDRITGVEDPKILRPGATNYFAQAWAQRKRVDERLGRVLPADQVAVTVNSPYGRSQDQLHLHIDCLDPAVHDALAAERAHVGPRWNSRIELKGHSYRIRWVAGPTLEIDPFAELAAKVPGARAEMGAWTLAVVGGEDAAGRPGFYLLADRANPLAGDRGSAEELQDHSCRAQLAGASQAGR